MKRWRCGSALSAHLDFPLEGLLPGNGSAEIFWLIALAFLEAGDRVLVAGPTFGEYARSAQIAGAQVIEVRARAEDQFRPDAGMISGALNRGGFRLAYICNPNNPTGQLLAAAQLAEWASEHPRTLFVIDEAYIAFAGPAAKSVIPLGLPNVLSVRSMTKDYALTGLRLGYAAGPGDIIAALRRVQPPWSVNSLAQAAGAAALQAGLQVQASLELLNRERGPGVRAGAARLHAGSLVGTVFPGKRGKCVPVQGCVAARRGPGPRLRFLWPAGVRAHRRPHPARKSAAAGRHRSRCSHDRSSEPAPGLHPPRADGLEYPAALARTDGYPAQRRRRGPGAGRRAGNSAGLPRA